DFTLGGDITGNNKNITAINTASFGANNISISGTTITTAGNNNALTLTPNGSGNTIVTSDYQRGLFVGSSSNVLAPLSVSGGIGSNALAIFNQNNSGDILAASASSTTKFVVSNGGNLSLVNNVNIDTLTSSGTINIAGGTNTSTLLLGKTGGTINLANFTAHNGVFYTAGNSTLAQTTDTITAGQCLVSGATAPSWSPCSGAAGVTTNWWTVPTSTGLLTPINSTLDLSLGGQSSDSAKF